MVCFFATRDEVVKVATPPLVWPVPISVVPSSNVTTSSSGIAPSVDVTVAVNVTDCPTKDGVPDVASLVTDGNSTAGAAAPPCASELEEAEGVEDFGSP